MTNNQNEGTLAEEGLMVREKPIEPKRVVETASLGNLADERTSSQPKEQITYRPIFESGTGKIAAYDTKLGGVIIFGSRDEKMILRELNYANKHSEDYEKWFPKQVVPERVAESSPLEQKAEQSSLSEDALPIVREADNLSLKSDKSEKTSDEETKEKYCRAKNCSAGVKGRAYPIEAKFCGVCGESDFTDKRRIISDRELKKLEKRIKRSAKAVKEGLGTNVRGVINYSKEEKEKIDRACEEAEHQIKDLRKNSERSSARVVAQDLGKIVRKVGRGVFKTVSYPIAGNLSSNLQSGIENLVGRKWYNGFTATGVSLATNSAFCISAMAIGCHYTSPQPPINFLPVAITAGGLFGIMESASRLGNLGSGSYDESKPLGSLIGKIVSLPIEAAVYGYDRAKKYVQGVRERAQKTK